jgi:hypothetical protein
MYTVVLRLRLGFADDHQGWDVPLNAVMVTLAFSGNFVPGPNTVLLESLS